MDISKKEAAAVSAAIAAHLAKPSRKNKTHEAQSEIQKTLELLLKRVDQLEKRLDELSLTMKEIKPKRK